MYELAHVFLPVTSITTLYEPNEFPRPPAASRVGQFEWPKRAGDLLKVRSAGSKLVDQVLHALNQVQ